MADNRDHETAGAGPDRQNETETTGQAPDTLPADQRREPARPELVTVEHVETDGATPGESRYRVISGGGNIWDVGVTTDGNLYYWGIVQDALGVESQPRRGYPTEQDALMAAVKSIEDSLRGL